ncbi:MAG: 2-oxo acid dehydrogenase subunit E2, partial [Thermoguttaceae bacterium]|nr:2-oxo acid dehydrogenase subunit E2 [Thermoguttaceae bacterium]
MVNVSLGPHRRPSMWRKMALAAWPHPSDPQVYARLEVDVLQALAFARRESQRSGQRITMLHLVARSVALALRQHPEANALVRWGRVYPRRHIDLFFQVAVPHGDLSGVVIRDVDAKGPAQIAQELHEKARAVKRGSDPVLAKARRRLVRTPALVYGGLLRVIEFLGYALNLSLHWFGIPKDPFGGAMVTDLASLGIAEGFAPLVPRTRVPL